MLVTPGLLVCCKALSLYERIQLVVARRQQDMPQAVEQPVVPRKQLWHGKCDEAQSKQPCRFCNHMLRAHAVLWHVSQVLSQYLQAMPCFTCLHSTVGLLQYKCVEENVSTSYLFHAMFNGQV